MTATQLKARDRARFGEDAAQLKAWRAKHGLSRGRAAEELGLTLSGIKAIESGQRCHLTPTLRKLMATLDLLERYAER